MHSPYCFFVSYISDIFYREKKFRNNSRLGCIQSKIDFGFSFPSPRNWSIIANLCMHYTLRPLLDKVRCQQWPTELRRFFYSSIFEAPVSLSLPKLTSSGQVSRVDFSFSTHVDTITVQGSETRKSRKQEEEEEATNGLLHRHGEKEAWHSPPSNGIE